MNSELYVKRENDIFREKMTKLKGTHCTILLIYFKANKTPMHIILIWLNYDKWAGKIKIWFKCKFMNN